MKLLFNSQQIEDKVDELATVLNLKHSYLDPNHLNQPVVFIGLLKGSFMFFSDLVKKLNFNLAIDFMQVSSYISEGNQGKVKIKKNIETDINGKMVYVVDDILDSGNTMIAVLELLSTCDPLQLNVVTLLKRKSSPTLKATHYNGFLINDEWLYGYGFNNDEGYCRNYPYLLSN